MSLYQNLAVSGLFRQEKRYDVIANNLSNAHTFGFKKDVPLFHKVLTDAVKFSLADDPVETRTLFMQGDLQGTQGELDVAIEGEGFFKVMTPGGIRYTRNGSFHLNREGVLVQANGFPILSNGREMNLKGGRVIIDQDGSVSVDGSNQGKIDLVTFPDLKGLVKEGSTLYRLESEQDEIEGKQGKMRQGALEISNVNALEEMIRMIDSLRSFESSHKVVQVEDDMNARAVNDLGKV
ncbi:MAG TPA: flagellar hook-basal body protein [Thermodesulfobacteriota bacterium]|nr:flagellar hook-basal body protein [Thermodesulfobacteriota bacterium]